MRRGLALLAVLAGLFGLSPFAQAQYPYAPLPYGPVPSYGYPPAMYQPAPYGPAYPAQYYAPAPRPAPMYYPPTTAPRVYNFGPLPEENAVSITTIVPDSPVVPTARTTSPTVAVSVPAAAPSTRTLVSLFKGHGAHGAKKEQGCGPQGCGPEGCGDACAACDVCIPPFRRQPRPCPRGHFFGDIGLFIFVAAPSNRSALVRTDAAGASTTTNFPLGVEYAPRASLGYVLHNGWGLRAEYWSIHGDVTETASNTNVAVTGALTTPTAVPFRISSPSASLIAGGGADQFTATQTIDLQAAVVEVVHECSLFDMTYLFGCGVRSGIIRQNYSATRTNFTNGFDSETVTTQSRYEGLGPTISLDGVCPIFHNCLSLYGNVRGTALFGSQDFDQSISLRSTTPAIVNTSNSSTATDKRTVYALEAELGFQLGWRVGKCYVFSRTGAAVQRWYEVGSPVSSTGSLSFLGGTFMLGLTY